LKAGKHNVKGLGEQTFEERGTEQKTCSSRET